MSREVTDLIDLTSPAPVQEIDTDALLSSPTVQVDDPGSIVDHLLLIFMIFRSILFQRRLKIYPQSTNQQPQCSVVTELNFPHTTSQSISEDCAILKVADQIEELIKSPVSDVETIIAHFNTVPNHDSFMSGVKSMLTRDLPVGTILKCAMGTGIRTIALREILGQHEAK